jgi:hypothetical protein
MVEKEKIREEACQVAFPAMGKNDPDVLAVVQIMMEMASQFDYGEGYMFGAPPFGAPSPKYPSI